VAGQKLCAALVVLAAVLFVVALIWIMPATPNPCAGDPVDLDSMPRTDTDDAAAGAAWIVRARTEARPSISSSPQPPRVCRQLLASRTEALPSTAGPTG
jgi:hypothetical protein